MQPTLGHDSMSFIKPDFSRRYRITAIRLRCEHVRRRLAIVLTLMLAASSYAAELAVPNGPVILTVDGAIINTNAGASARFDREMLESLPQLTVRTVTPWTEGITVFRGPRGRDLLAAVGAQGTHVVATAINDYQVEIPTTDFTQIAVILAIRRDGQPMRVRDKGPIWVIYPWSDNPGLKTEIYHSRSIWQLKALTIK